MTRRRLSFHKWRDPLLFLTGLGLTIHYALIYSGPERPSLLLVYAGMMGLPAFLKHDEKRAGAPDESSKEPTA